MKCWCWCWIYDPKQKHQALHTSERTIVPRTVIFHFRTLWDTLTYSALTTHTGPPDPPNPAISVVQRLVSTVDCVLPIFLFQIWVEVAIKMTPDQVYSKHIVLSKRISAMLGFNADGVLQNKAMPPMGIIFANTHFFTFTFLFQI